MEDNSNQLVTQSMAEEFLLGIDLGTSSLKLGLFAVTGRLLSLEQIHYDVGFPRPGYTEIDPEVWWQAVRLGLSKINKDLLGKVKAIGLSVLYPALIAMDRNGRALRPAILYSDRRSASQLKSLDRIMKISTVEKLIGNRVMPGTCSLTSVQWIREVEPAVYSQTYSFGHANTFLAHRLTGNFAMDMTNAYVKKRMTYGNPVASYQVVQHYLADVWIDVETSKNLVYLAAWKICEGLPCGKEVSAAKAWVGKAFTRVTERCVQMHGAIGLTREHDIGLYYRNAKACDLAFGDSHYQREVIAREMC